MASYRGQGANNRRLSFRERQVDCGVLALRCRTCLASTSSGFGMKLFLSKVGALVVISILSFGGGCNAFDPRSGALECSGTGDCIRDRVCQDGYCVVDVLVTDADPNTPDADPNAPDADPNTPDAAPSAPDANIGSTVTFVDDFSSGVWGTGEWLAEKLGSNSKIEVVDEEGRLFFGTTNPAWARATLLGHDTTDTDLTLQFRFEHIGTEGQLRFFLRANGAFGENGYPDTGYAVVVTNSSGALALVRVSGGLPTTLAGGSWTADPDLSIYNLRFQVVGTTVRGMVWASSSAEPSTWNVEVSDAANTGAGDFRVEYFKVSSARAARVDNISLSGN